MRITTFDLERFFDLYEFDAEILLCASDIESWTLPEVLNLASGDQTRRWESLSFGYTQTAGHPMLRSQISALYEDIAPDQILTFAGAEEGIFVIANVLLDESSHAVVVVPSYQSLHEVATATGAEVTKIALGADWALPLDDIEAAIQANTRLVVINSPNNPTGTVASTEDLRRLTAECESVGATLFCDEVYRFLHHEGSHPAAAADISPTAASLGVMSKSYAMPGLRIGWIASRDQDLMRRLAEFKDYTSICNSAPSELLAEIALDNSSTILGRSREIVESNLAVADAFFHKWDGAFRWTRPAGGTTAFPEFTTAYGIEEFTKQLMTEERVLLAPASLFGWSGNNFRLGMGRRNFPEGMERLDRFAETHFS